MTLWKAYIEVRQTYTYPVSMYKKSYLQCFMLSSLVGCKLLITN